MPMDNAAPLPPTTSTPSITSSRMCLHECSTGAAFHCRLFSVASSAQSPGTVVVCGLRVLPFVGPTRCCLVASGEAWFFISSTCNTYMFVIHFGGLLYFRFVSLAFLRLSIPELGTTSNENSVIGGPTMQVASLRLTYFSFCFCALTSGNARQSPSS